MVAEREEIKQLIKEIEKHNYLYYTLGKPIIPDFEYDKIYDRLVELEKKSGIVYANSPTRKVGWEVKSELNKNKLQYPLKSLDKTKNINELKEFVGTREVVVMVKCDGLTNELVYKDRKLKSGTTRGNGEVGELITDNVNGYMNIPYEIKVENAIIVGEAIIFKNDFLDINSKLDEEEKFANPRNLVSGSVRQLNPQITKNRKVSFLAFGVNGNNLLKTKIEELEYVENLGFDVAPYLKSNIDNIESDIVKLRQIAEEKGIPYDGMVVLYNDLSLMSKLGTTAKFPRYAKAFKFKDEEAETILRGVEYNTSRNGILTPVAVFDSVELEGTEVERASLHNLSILKQLRLGIGDEIVVYKANQIIPQVARNNTESNTYEIIKQCPICSCDTEIRGDFLYCSNENCKSKLANKIAHFCGRNAMEISGLSIKKAEIMINNNLLTGIESLYSLKDNKNKLYSLEGMGIKSTNKLIDEIEKSKVVKPYNFLYALGIPQIGLETAKVICKEINIKNIFKMKLNDFRAISGLGDVASEKIFKYINENRKLVEFFLDMLIFENDNMEVINSNIKDKIFVITGKVDRFTTRNELKAKIESLGGKVTGTVSKNTDYLINNDIESNSSKNKKAKELGVEIINEDKFLSLI